MYYYLAKKCIINNMMMLSVKRHLLPFTERNEEFYWFLTNVRSEVLSHY